jgi:hypothetical protein
MDIPVRTAQVDHLKAANEAAESQRPPAPGATSMPLPQRHRLPEGGPHSLPGSHNRRKKLGFAVAIAAVRGQSAELNVCLTDPKQLQSNELRF